MNIDDLTPEDLAELAKRLAPLVELEQAARLRRGLYGSGWTSPTSSTVTGPVHYS